LDSLESQGLSEKFALTIIEFGGCSPPRNITSTGSPNDLPLFSCGGVRGFQLNHNSETGLANGRQKQI
jgi:hypothetical protein